MYLLYQLWDRLNQNRHVRKVTGNNITACESIVSLPRLRSHLLSRCLTVSNEHHSLCRHVYFVSNLGIIHGNYVRHFTSYCFIQILVLVT